MIKELSVTHNRGDGGRGEERTVMKPEKEEKTDDSEVEKCR